MMPGRKADPCVELFGHPSEAVAQHLRPRRAAQLPEPGREIEIIHQIAERVADVDHQNAPARLVDRPGGAGEGIGADTRHEAADADQPPGAARTALEVVADVGVEGAEHQPDRDQHREVDADHHVFQSVHHRVLSAVFSVPFRKIRRAGVPGCSIRRTASSITSAPASCQSSAMVSTGS